MDSGICRVEVAFVVMVERKQSRQRAHSGGAQQAQRGQRAHLRKAHGQALGVGRQEAVAAVLEPDLRVGAQVDSARAGPSALIEDCRCQARTTRRLLPGSACLTFLASMVSGSWGKPLQTRERERVTAPAASRAQKLLSPPKQPSEFDASAEDVCCRWALPPTSPPNRASKQMQQHESAPQHARLGPKVARSPKVDEEADEEGKAEEGAGARQRDGQLVEERARQQADDRHLRAAAHTARTAPQRTSALGHRERRTLVVVALSRCRWPRKRVSGRGRGAVVPHRARPIVSAAPCPRPCRSRRFVPQAKASMEARWRKAAHLHDAPAQQHLVAQHQHHLALGRHGDALQRRQRVGVGRLDRVRVAGARLRRRLHLLRRRAGGWSERKGTTARITKCAMPASADQRGSKSRCTMSRKEGAAPLPGRRRARCSPRTPCACPPPAPAAAACWTRSAAQ